MKKLWNGERLNTGLLEKMTEKPELFATGEPLWTDPYIAEQMLDAHLNPNWDAASRKHEIIKMSARWLIQNLKLKKRQKVLDLGCGPGLYCEEFCRHGLDVVGVDFSKNSIDYAKKHAEENTLPIEYVCANYLEIDYEEEFDAVFLIYCDLGALSNEERDALLKKVHKALKPGGAFVFDVWTHRLGDNKAAKAWGVYSTAGFWRPDPHIELSQRFYYENANSYLTQYVIIDEDGEMSVYRVWDHVYSAESISRVVSDSSLHVESTWGGLMGEPYVEGSECLGIVARKYDHKGV